MKKFEEFKALLDQLIKEYSFSEVAWGDVDAGHGIKVVHEHGGGEGEGDYVERVLEWNGLYAKFVGSYSSYCGTDWDESFEQVFPKEKTITVYE